VGGGDSEVLKDGEKQLPVGVVRPEVGRGPVRERGGEWYSNGDMVGARGWEGGLPTFDAE